MNKLVVILGALFLAAPVFSQGAVSELTAPVPSQGLPEITALSLTESRAAVTKLMGSPASIEALGDLESWRYQIGVEDNHDFSHSLVFRISTGELISATHNFEPAQLLDTMFPAAETRVYHYPDAQHPQYSVRLRKLDSGRLLLATGSSKPGAPVSQILLIRESELPHFYSWIADQMQTGK